jgi:Zn-dependent M28 family amino/carboxypeptidase
MRPILAALVLAACAAPPAPRAPTPAAAKIAVPGALKKRPEVAQAIAEITPERAKRVVEELAKFGTRHTLSDTSSPTRGIGAARAWIKRELEGYAQASGRTGELAMQVSFDTHVQPADGQRVTKDTEIVNVMAVLPGAVPEARARRYYVVGHYDSRATDPLDATSDAPGANDDASGVAVVLEAARVLSKRRWDATIVFLATAGEEQGLYGAKLHAKAARAAGLDVRAVLNDDIVGDPTGPGGKRNDAAIRVFSEGLPASATEIGDVRKLAAESDSPSREIARFVAEVGALYPGVAPALVFRPDRFMRGGDHLAFNEQGFAAVRFTTVFETYERQHQNVRPGYGDLPDFVDGAYLAGVARLNAATLAHLASAPSPPADARIVTAELGQDVVLRWTKSPDPDVAGYEITWRPTTAATWSEWKDVGDVIEAKLPLSKDDLFLGVRAYDKDGYASPVAFARAAPK